MIQALEAIEVAMAGSRAGSHGNDSRAAAQRAKPLAAAAPSANAVAAAEKAMQELLLVQFPVLGCRHKLLR